MYTLLRELVLPHQYFKEQLKIMVCPSFKFHAIGLIQEKKKKFHAIWFNDVLLTNPTVKGCLTNHSNLS